MSTSWIKVCCPQDNSVDSYYVSCTNFTFYYHIRTRAFTWWSLSSFLMRIEITWSKVELATFLLLRNALDLFRNVLDRCFIEITLSKVKSIFFFWKMFLKIKYVWWQNWIKHHGYLSQEFIRYLWHCESRYLIENLMKIILDL